MGASRKGTGILGGTFNPPHVGHLALGRAAANDLGLERVLLCPALQAPHKPAGQEDPGAEHRLRMCRLAVESSDPLLGVCTLELERAGPSYTVDTLRSIHANDPGAEVTLIVGADTARTLGSWREPAEILRLARLAVAKRDGSSVDQVLEALAKLDGKGSTVFIDMSPVRVSSSMVRERVAAGEPIDDLVGAEVAGYIAEHGLYGSTTTPQVEVSTQ